MRARNWIWGCIFISVLLLPASGLAQEDTLILLGSNPYRGGYAVSVSNEYAFVGSHDSIGVADYSGPPILPPVTSYAVNGCRDIEIRGRLAYYVGDSLYIRDITDPFESEVVGTCLLQSSNWAFRVHLFDSLALAMYTTPWEECYLAIIDISNPTNPQLLSTNSPPPYGSTSTLMDAWKKDKYVYWVDAVILTDPWQFLGRIIVLDITDPTEPVPIVVDTCLPSIPSAIWIKGNYAYVALINFQVDHGGLMVLDISDPYNIDSVGFFEIPYEAHNIFIEGSLGFLSAEDGLYALDITDPINPTLVTYYDTPSACMDVFVDEPYVLVAEQASLLLLEASFLIAGDVNWDREVNSSDVIYLINYLFVNGPEPPIPNLADVNSDCGIDAADVVYLINYLFIGGPTPQFGGC